MQDLSSVLSDVRQSLAALGYYYCPTFSTDQSGADLLALARALGGLYVSPGTDLSQPVLHTRPSAEAPLTRPFDRPEQLGWHNDFSSHAERPAISLAQLVCSDPHGTHYGAWRVASCRLVIEELNATREGRGIVHFLLENDLPFSFSDEDQPSFLRVIEQRGPSQGLGMRFYGRTLRAGARLAHGAVPKEIERALTAVEAAADRVGCILAAPAGALLVTDSWHSLHDRLAQTVDPSLPLRRSAICFVDVLA